MKITKDMSILEVVQKYPDTAMVFMYAGMGCIGCAAAHFENIEAGANVHGIDVDKLVEALNEVAEAQDAEEAAENEEAVSVAK
ncbi:MAG: DUF1858 domain-containing protein [Selenomonadaceae bacterium]|nr:DUF1858 domain-containing protein [Selenomonadaceae bacterium]